MDEEQKADIGSAQPPEKSVRYVFSGKQPEVNLQTRQCPFCAEVIQSAAVKCRFCGEFLNTSRAAALMTAAAPTPQQTAGEILFEASPSVLGMTGSVIKAMFFFCFGIFLMAYRLEEKLLSDTAGELPAAIGRYRVFAGLAIAALAMIILAVRIIRLKSVRYRIAADRIEHERGIFSRKIDNLDVFRIIDIKLRRNLFDYIFGIGTVELATKDQSDPKFVFQNVRNARRLYDVLKKASLDADQRQRVVHLE